MSNTTRILVATGLLFGSVCAQAQTVIFFENFNSGVGTFTPTGTVNGGGTGASMHGRVQGSSWITSPPINTLGRTNLTLAWTQMCLNSDAGEGCVVLYSTNNINWNVVYATSAAAFNSPASVTLPAAANNQSQLRLRFQRVANSFEEVYDVDNILLTAGGTGGSDTVAPTTPASLSASANGTTINLSWSASTDAVGVTGYLVERCSGSSCTNFSQVATPVATSYADNGLAASTTFRYRVRATDAAGNLSGYSPIANATTGTTQPTGCSGTPATLPTPTVALLEATAGPLATSSYTVPSPSGYGSGTITYPTSGNCYPGIVLMPGYQGTQENLQWMAPRLASWGFTVINVGTTTLSDDPDSRGMQIRNAGTQLLNLSAATGNPIANKVRSVSASAGLGVSGHSMGGGGTMVALRDDARFTAGAPLAPYHPSGNFGSVTKPTFFLVCASDAVAGGNTYAKPWYNSMSGAEKLYLSVPGDHLCPMTGYGNKAKQGKYLVSWFSRWLKADTTYSQFLCTDSIRNTDKNNTSIVTEWMDTCPF